MWRLFIGLTAVCWKSLEVEMGAFCTSCCHSNEKEEQYTILYSQSWRKEWEKLNYDIHALRYSHREVCVHWKKILLLLGYQREVDSLLAVNKQSLMTDGENLERTRELLYTVCEESGLFPSGIEPNDRFLFIMDRLVSLDSTEDFVRLTKEKYPRTKL
ncbi:melanoregulin-like [Hemibagrus wyckioides]|uniref:melanoregulin-like n=1 Tax=Hemibagrus wyckioides TaxID=337641 RepID=UPI00266CAD07|nr:melanoregulin-like [Hemibagrus wyckioides]